MYPGTHVEVYYIYMPLAVHTPVHGCRQRDGAGQRCERFHSHDEVCLRKAGVAAYGNNILTRGAVDSVRDGVIIGDYGDNNRTTDESHAYICHNCAAERGRRLLWLPGPHHSSLITWPRLVRFAHHFSAQNVI